MIASAVVRITNVLLLYVSDRTGCTPPNAPYVVYTDERGQVTCAACLPAPPPLASHLPLHLDNAIACSQF